LSLEGKTVLVTGGTAEGLGGAMVRAFHAEGARVITCGVNPERVEQTRDELPDVTVVRADVTKPADCDQLVAAAGAIDVLCNHVGGTFKEGVKLAHEMADDEWERNIAVNLTSTFMMCRRVLPGMMERGGGVITNTGSICGLRAGRCGGVSYVAAKFGLVGLTQNIAAVYWKDGIRCNAICPGPVAVREGVDRPSSQLTFNTHDFHPRLVELLQRDHAVEYPPECPPELIAGTAVYLARDEASFVNGVIIPIDSGWIAF
jgi:NAD(P)-dependent dehydrogenase (short-subunit alcohol dehydrogenase family)